ncbi:LLM class flavin-dependent oxidoreductase [Tenggerimyces flavus]|uniref:LLM class flavin-dependent oxidoreductase n=1 Tax=Tenggerimyces flavus TaxID=1708749 RepID=A0ABV7YE19_9ACTN|nr:LLM class flavin-dependent oxidoreductase [Tenggerimyces flavus]MBM7786030.1 alkanesulfonate monooxygenase SsuD/methylene tetrahydromethanopterin reductase-like flavin-dependent oxidoreductase (luciferase family) [Tenggerimyces flavus]
MRFGLDVPIDGSYADPRLLADLAYDAEAAGWDGFFLQDGLGGPKRAIDPWIGLTAVTLRTERVKLGVFLTPLPRRRPGEVAMQAATIDHLSGGRLIFGAAVGHAEHDFVPFGDAWDLRVRAQQLDEALEVVAGLWTGRPFSFEGTHFRLTDAQIAPPPLQSPRVPVWVATGWPHRKPMRRAVRWDGVYLMTDNQATDQPISVEDIAAAAAFAKELRGDAPFEVAANGWSDTPAVAEYEDAGATWWIALAPESPEAYRSVIQQGPPG